MEDAGARRNFISNCLGILRATRGRGLVVSSEARGVLGVRAPADVINLMAVWGLGRERGMESLNVNPRSVVENERIKRTSFRGVIDVIDGGERDLGKSIRTGGPTGIDQEIHADGSGAGKKSKGKRKANEKEASGDRTLPLSKRQAKKMRLEALKAEKESSAKDAAPSKGSLGESGESDTLSTINSKENG